MSLYFPQAAVTLRVVFENFGKDDATLEEKYEFTCQPKSVEIEKNDYREADTFKMELDYKNFPFDPRTLRSVGVTIHMEDVKRVFDDRGVQVTIKPSAENTMFVGFADEETISFDSNTRTVRMEGRDLTALMIDQKFPGPPINQSEPLLTIIRKQLDALQATEGIEIVNEIGGPIPEPANLLTDTDPLANKKNSKKGDKYWDVLQKLLQRLGLVGFFRLDKFILARPRNAYVGTQGFTQFVYGVNLKTLEFKRKLGRLKGINIKVTGLDFERKQVITALIPKEAKSPDLAKLGEQVRPVIKADGSKGKPEPAPYITFKVSSIRDKNHLIEKGEEIYYEYSRQQIEGRLSTYEMLLPERVFNNGVPTERINKIDFSKIQNGTPIEVFISQDDMKQIAQIKSFEDKKKYLIDKFYAPRVAEALARSMNKVSTPFYTKTARFMLDAESGFNMDLEFLNIVDLNNANLDI
jgi:hypothetical protein